MKEGLKKFLKRVPTFYRFIVRTYRYSVFKFRYLEDRFLGTKVREKEWATRHLRKGASKDDWGKGHDDWLNGYWDSFNHPHRKFLIKNICKFNPSSILEIGCNCGPNLRLLSKKIPDAKIMGLEINPLAVQKGNYWLRQEGISNVQLIEGKADDLRQFPNKNFDVVFTDAVLIYIGPDKIKNIMKEMLRVARKGLILVEWNTFEQQKDPYGLGLYAHGYWQRDYTSLLKQFVPEKQIHITKISRDIWPDKYWSQVGALIEVEMQRKHNKFNVLQN